MCAPFATLRGNDRSTLARVRKTFEWMMFLVLELMPLLLVSRASVLTQPTSSSHS